MKYSHKLSDAVHILAFISIYGQADSGVDLSSGTIASSVESNPSLVRRMMSALVKAGLLTSRPGTVSPKLARPLAHITLLEVYQAIESNQNLLHIDPKTNPDCIVGGNIQETLNHYYQNVQTAAETAMAAVTLDMIVSDILERNARA
ncbi:Rrf2 family transcriptional regulator [Agrilactobacillus yilanensis]|uniref:Rrf2 family transcriptional regulator n=1 Tax=Agrilactobacillus yilanensis TaxID=2485997 RepID=A0ABW4J9T1_9LACO|nr:Rrf2 family transcriptional regulator [Agrilactobacillus yilanensis]